MLYHCMRLSATFLSHCQYPFLKLWISLTSFISHQLSLNQQSFAFPDLSSFLTDLIIFIFLKENEIFYHKKFDQSMFFLVINLLVWWLLLIYFKEYMRVKVLFRFWCGFRSKLRILGKVWHAEKKRTSLLWTFLDLFSVILDCDLWELGCSAVIVLICLLPSFYCSKTSWSSSSLD